MTVGSVHRILNEDIFSLSSIYNRSQFHGGIKHAYASTEQGCSEKLQWLLLAVVLCVITIFFPFCVSFTVFLK